MLKASALYIVIAISLVIAVLCSSLIVVAYYYRSDYQEKFRYDRLRNNLESGINILLASPDTSYRDGKTVDLFGTGDDSVYLQKIPWGVYDIGVVKSYTQRDTLYKTFSIAHIIDSSKWGALYLADEERPVSVSGKTAIRGNAWLPKSGITQVYIDNRAYTGDKRLVAGKKLSSEKNLPQLDISRLQRLDTLFAVKGDSVMASDSLTWSFLKPAKIYDFRKEVTTLSDLYLKGNIILHSDTILTIDSTVKLDHILVFAPSIIVKSGFAGNCQLFAADSVSIGRNCHFGYPSCAGIVRFRPPKTESQAKVAIGERTRFEGLIFTYEQKPGGLKPLVTIGKTDTIQGMVYSQAILQLQDQSVIDGFALTSRFLYKSSVTLYENYLINTTLDATALSRYYLSSDIVPVVSKKERILQWLEAN